MPPKRARPVESTDASRKRTKLSNGKPLQSTIPTRTIPRAPDLSTNAGTIGNAAASNTLKIFVFGEGTAGELGLGNVKGAAQAKIPRRNAKLEDVVAIAAGGMHGVAINTAGKVLTWGGNDDSALGRETPPDDDSDEDDDAPGLSPNEATPTVISSISKRIVQVTAGDSCTFALTDDGFVYGWGTFRNKNGVYGFTFDNGNIVKHQKTPLLIPGLERITQICAGADFALALDADGHVYGWGPNEQGETGYRLVPRRHHPAEALLPHRVPLSRTKVVSIHAGISHAFAIDNLGRVWSWGLNNYGQTGIASGAGQNQPVIYVPQKVQSFTQKIKTVTGGAHHSIALTQDGTCLVWGRIDGGQTGLDKSSFKDSSSDVIFDQDNKPRILLIPTPLQVPRCTAIAAGTDHSIAVTESGKAYSWGLNASAQCGQGTEDDIDVAKLMQAKTIVEEQITFAAGGGQFSIMACSH